MLDDSRFVRDAAARRLRESAGTGGDGKPALWAEGFGNWSARDGDGNAARVTDSTGGLMGSVDVGLFGTWRLGVIGGYSHTNIAVAARTSEAQSANYHLGAYAGAQWDAWRVRLGAAHSWQSVRTTRSIDIMGLTQTLDGRYSAGTTQVFGEGGYHLDWDQVALEPFAALASAELHMPAFPEGADSAALSGRRDAQHVVFSTLGLHGDTGLDLDGLRASLRATLGWRHAAGETGSLTRLAFQGSGSFEVAGVPIAQDSAMLEMGAGLEITRRLSLDIGYTGQFAGAITDHGVRGRLRFAF